MMFAGGKLRMALATWHVPLNTVARELTPERLERAVRRADWLCRAEGIARPRIAVCGLNPHAGEHGLLGDEEEAGKALRAIRPEARPLQRVVLLFDELLGSRRRNRPFAAFGARGYLSSSARVTLKVNKTLDPACQRVRANRIPTVHDSALPAISAGTFETPGKTGRRIPVMGKKLYVGNLSFNTYEDGLRDLFQQYGNVVSAKIITDRDSGSSKGFGFVEMSSDAEAAAAIAGTNGIDLDGRNIKVNEAMDKPRRDGNRY